MVAYLEHCLAESLGTTMVGNLEQHLVELKAVLKVVQLVAQMDVHLVAQ